MIEIADYHPVNIKHSASVYFRVYKISKIVVAVISERCQRIILRGFGKPAYKISSVCFTVWIQREMALV